MSEVLVVLASGVIAGLVLAAAVLVLSLGLEYLM